jgi:hypothetical protein
VTHFNEDKGENMFFYPEHPFVKGVQFFLFLVWGLFNRKSKLFFGFWELHNNFIKLGPTLARYSFLFILKACEQESFFNWINSRQHGWCWCGLPSLFINLHLYYSFSTAVIKSFNTESKTNFIVIFSS